jgi:hypothetical protein
MGGRPSRDFSSLLLCAAAGASLVLALASCTVSLSPGSGASANPTSAASVAVSLPIGGARGLYSDALVDSVAVEIALDADASVIGSGNLQKIGGAWSGSINVKATGNATASAIAKGALGGRLYTGSEPILIEEGGNHVSVGMAAYAYAIGDTGPAGGLVFYDKGSYSDGWRYMEAAPSDQSAGICWKVGDYWDYLSGADHAEVGSGKTNTAIIVAAHGVDNYAAYLCSSLSLGGFQDWFLPSMDELNLMYSNLYLHGLGAFNGIYSGYWCGYWSSTDLGNGFAAARVQYFVDGSTYVIRRDLNEYVRAAREF